MFSEILFGILIPFFGTAIGAAAVFFLKRNLPPLVSQMLNGFAAGVMLAASIWSLLLPAIESSKSPLTPILGFFTGVFLLIALDKVVLYMFANDKNRTGLSKSHLLLLLAVALHNLPEGIAVGVIFAEYLLSGSGAVYTAAFALSLGIAIQNLPEGAIISCPLYASGTGRVRSFFLGTASGVIEPIAAVLAIAAIGIASNLLPFLLSLTAGAMIYVTIKNLVPEFTEGEKLTGIVFFSLGFSLMMLLDTTL